ncbi:winged helix-turn-helix domain-containing protein [Celeribacter persicus]|uniref:Molybdate transport system regulatory protein n=1 Tax=Celeribacter persicus TaxID=1651082 RepID=A0A2T5HUI5_9RHOB|nr:LysR family transcriptional regulator [Celeribacter persicus]PTQ75231.1 molybdate transport system regulatory protein [Celeribacter persicus]
MSDATPLDVPPLGDDTRLRLRIHFGDRLMLGPGKADLLEGIRDTGSIAAAGRAMSMSYKRAWSLVEDMNAAFREPLVASARGGTKGGGAHLTETGEAVLAQYRAIVAETEVATKARIAAIRGMLVESTSDMSKGK